MRSGGNIAELSASIILSNFHRFPFRNQHVKRTVPAIRSVHFEIKRKAIGKTTHDNLPSAFFEMNRKWIWITLDR